MTTANDLSATRHFYDTVADDYAEHFGDTFERQPLDRALLTAFADLVRESGCTGPVADVGCGPGHLTARLDALGLPVFGVDLSPRMVELARRTHPGLRFQEASMVALDLPDGALGGLVAWYSIIHLPQRQLPEVFAEFRRVLAPGAPLLVAFQVGDQPLRLEKPFGHPVTLDFRRRRPEEVAALLARAGLPPHAQLVREQEEGQGSEPIPQAFLLARRPVDEQEP